LTLRNAYGKTLAAYTVPTSGSGGSFGLNFNLMGQPTGLYFLTAEAPGGLKQTQRVELVE
jgi:hypothetical protein